MNSCLIHSTSEKVPTTLGAQKQFLKSTGRVPRTRTCSVGKGGKVPASLTIMVIALESVGQKSLKIEGC